MQLFPAAALAVWYCLILEGSGKFVGRLIVKLYGKEDLEGMERVLGYAVFPVLLAVGGFLRLWMIPWITEAAGLALGVYGAHTLWTERRAYRAKLSDRWLRYAVICLGLALIALLIPKIGYLAGGHAHDDEGRSLVLTVLFAANGLKPAFPYAASLPVAYPWYSFETSAFLYRSAHGVLFPSIAILAVTIGNLTAFALVLYKLWQRMKGAHAASLSLLTGALLLFSTMKGFRTPVQTVNHNLVAGYHYLFGILLGTFGVSILWSSLKSGNRKQWAIAVLCIALSLGHTAIPGMWIIFQTAVVLLLGGWLLGWGRVIGLGVRMIPLSVLTVVLVLLPQFANFLPRLAETFSFSLPHLWFPNSAGKFIGGSVGILRAVLSLEFSFLVLLLNVGPFLLAGAAYGILLFFLRRKNLKDEPLLPIATGILVSALLLTITEAPSGDWYSRGMILPTVLSAFTMAAFLHPLLTRKNGIGTMTRVCTLVLLCVLGVSFLIEQRSRVAVFLSPTLSRWRETPLDVPYYTVSAENPVSSDIISAGRAVIEVPPITHQAFLNNPAALKTFGIVGGFGPCSKSAFGSNAPAGRFAVISGSGAASSVQIVPCSAAPDDTWQAPTYTL
jgi:hypothetical protein